MKKRIKIFIICGLIVSLNCFAYGQCEGDINGDGVVDGQDLSVLAADYGVCGNDSCSGIECGDYGICSGGECYCTSNYTGENCEIPPGPCYPNPCQNGGACADSGGAAECFCVDGYTGDTCEIPPAVSCNQGSCLDGVCDQVTNSCVAHLTYPSGPYGTSAATVIENIVLPGPDGFEYALIDPYSLYQSVGYPKALLIVFSNMGCGPSQWAAGELQSVYNAHASLCTGYNEVEIVTILTATPPSAPPSLTDATLWTNTFGLTTPVTVDVDLNIGINFQITATPTLLFIDPRTMEIIERVEGFNGTQSVESSLAPIIAGN